MRALVTGGAGFIGSHLVDALVARGDEVIVVDNLATGKREYVNPKSRFAFCDIRDFAALSPLFRGVEAVFHAAALARVKPSFENPLPFNEVNVQGTLNVLLAARDAGVRRVIYSSSSSVYGPAEEFPLYETMVPHPQSPYALQKYVGELYCRLFSECYGISTVSLRYFNVYGERQPETGAYALVLGIFLRARARGEPLPVAGDGENRRDYVCVDDVVRANMLASTSSKVGNGEVMNIGSGKDWSVNDIARLVGGPTMRIPPRVEPRATRADIRKARELLGWKPETGLEEWIAEFKKRHGVLSED